MSVRDDHDAALRSRMVHAVRESTGLHETLAAVVAKAIFEFLMHELRGEQVYYRKRLEVSAEQLAAEYDGANRKELCRKYSIGKSTFYRLIGAARGVSRGE